MLSSKPHFFQPLNVGFVYEFSIPKSFVKHIRGSDDEDENGDKIVILRDKRKMIWSIKMVDYHFKDGWDSFCKEHNLHVDDFVVFKYHGQLVFDVFIYDSSTCCEKLFPNLGQSSKVGASSFLCVLANTSSNIPKKIKGTKKQKKNEKQRGRVVAKQGVEFKPSGFPYWKAVIKSCYATWGGIPIPKSFARENGLIQRWCEMVLIDEKEQPWTMTLRHRKGTTGSVYIGSWRRFHQTIGLKPGDDVVFELLHNGQKPVIKFSRIQKKGAPIEAKTGSCSKGEAPKEKTKGNPDLKGSSVEQPIVV